MHIMHMCVNVMDRIRTNERKLHKGKRQRRVPNKCMMYWKKNATNIIVKMKAIESRHNTYVFLSPPLLVALFSRCA